MVKTWLFAWEYGDGLGHLKRLAAVAAALARGDDRVVVAANGPAPSTAFFPPGTEVITLPALAEPVTPEAGPGFLPSYGASLAQLGFEDAGYLTARVKAWDEVFDRLKPSALIADYAPAAVFAANGHLPTAVIGSGLDLPPVDGERFPTLLADTAPFDETALLRALREAASATGRATPRTVPDALAGYSRWLAGLPTFDPYRGRRSETYLGPLGVRSALTTCPSEGFLFVYMRSDLPSFRPLCQSLAELGLPGCVHWQGPPAPGEAALLAGRGMTVAATPVDVVQMLARASLVITLGGAGLTMETLYAGRPHLIFPIHLESEIHARGLETLGAGRRLSPGGLTQQIELAADTLALRDGALKAGGAAHRDFGEDPAPIIAAGIRALA